MSDEPATNDVEAEAKKMNDWISSFFAQVFSSGSIPGGVLRAARPNNSVEWSEEEDSKRSEKNLDSSIAQYDAAVTRLATRR